VRAYRTEVDDDLGGLEDDSDAASCSESFGYKPYRKEVRSSCAA